MKTTNATPDIFSATPRSLIERLRAIAALKPGSELPDWLPINNWAPIFQHLCTEAADQLKALMCHDVELFQEIEEQKAERDNLQRMLDEIVKQSLMRASGYR